MCLPAALETVLLSLTVFFPFYWQNQSYLSKFTLQLVSLLILLFFLHAWISNKAVSSKPIQTYQMITKTIIITITVLLLILTTGGANSAFFFILDFLLFFAAVFIRPEAGITLSLAIVTAFLLNEPDITKSQLINLISLLLMTPLAVIFSTQYRRLITTQQKINILSNQTKDEETATLMWLSLNFRNQLIRAIDLVSLIKTNLGLIPTHQRNQLEQLYRDLKALWLSGQELEKKIDEATEENNP